jgi:hypothetical protein
LAWRWIRMRYANRVSSLAKNETAEDKLKELQNKPEPVSNREIQERIGELQG